MTSDSCCPEELKQQSVHSPDGVIEDREVILRAVYNEIHIDDGKLSPTNIPLSQIIEPKGNGYSVNRLEYLTEYLVARMVLNFEQKNSANKFQGFFSTSAEELRALRSTYEEKDIRVCCIIDDGLEEDDKNEPDCSHALIIPSRHLRRTAKDRAAEKKAKKDLKPLRESLIESFSEFLSVEEL